MEDEKLTDGGNCRADLDVCVRPAPDPGKLRQQRKSSGDNHSKIHGDSLDRKLFYQYFYEQVALHKNKVAVITETGRFSYLELSRQVSLLSRCLLKKGVGKGCIVALLLPRSELLPVAIIAIHKIGASYLPLDPEYPRQRIEYILDDAGVSHIVLDSSFDALVGSRKIEKIDAKQVIYDGTVRGTSVSDIEPVVSNTGDNSLENNSASCDDEQLLAYVIYTSGSTGNPKGVMLTQGNLSNFLCAMSERPGLCCDDVVLSVTTISFDIAVLELLLPLAVGASTVIVSRQSALDPVVIEGLLLEHDITVMQATPSLWQMMLAANWRGKSDLKLLTGGESIPQNLSSQLTKIVAQVWNMYGPTETTVWSTCYKIVGDETPLIGTPINKTQVYIVDKDQRLVPDDKVGELWIGGDGVAQGYLGRAKLTREKFIDDPFSGESGARLYKTGDRVRRREDGNIECLGRLDFQVKVRGYRIELGEIENQLLGFSGISQAIVVVREDKVNDKRIVAYYISPDIEVINSGELRAYLKRRLPGYMVPQHFEKLMEFPLTPNGKIDRKALPEPIGSESEKDLNSHVTLSETEKYLLGLWQELIGVDMPSIESSFFDLGGHSLLATQLISKISNQYGVKIPLSVVFDKPTIQALAPIIDGKLNRAESKNDEQSAKNKISIATQSQREYAPLSYAQKRLWFIDRLEPGSPIYNIPVVIKLTGKVEQHTLTRFFDALLAKHDILRTYFKETGDGPRQYINRTNKVIIESVDLTGCSSELLEKHLSYEFLKSFDLSSYPLFRIQLIKLADDSFILFLVIHHIIFDGWSVKVLLDDLAGFFEGGSENNKSRLRPLPQQFADFSEWHNQCVDGDEVTRQLEVWLDTLKGDLPVLSLPQQRLRPPVRSAAGTTEVVVINSSRTQLLQRQCKALGVTSFMYFLSLYYLLLHRYSAQQDLIVGVPVANRNMTQIESMIGFFVNTLPLRIVIDKQMTFAELLKRVKERCLLAYDNQDVPFERLVSRLSPERDASRTPIYQTMFNYVQSEPVRQLGDKLSAELIQWEGRVAKTDLSLTITEGDFGYRLALEYSDDLFDPGSMQMLLKRFDRLTDSVLDNHELKIDHYSIVLPEEEQKQIRDWNDTFKDFGQPRCLHQFFEKQVEKTPDEIALDYQGQLLTYRQLNERANQLAHYLRSHGVCKDAIVGICAERSLELVIALYGVLKAGGAYVPLDPEHPQARLAFMLQDTRASIILTQQHLLERIPSENSALCVCLDSDWETVAANSVSNLVSNSSADNMVYVIYTSGSTGNPKGVVNNHRGVVNRLEWMLNKFQLGSDDRFLQKTPYSFDVSVWEFFWPLACGARLVLAKPGGHQDALYLSRVIEQKQITSTHFVPSVLKVFVDTATRAQCDSLTKVFCSGEALSFDLQQQFFSLCRAQLHNLYGPTEAAIEVTYWQCRPNTKRKLVPIGKPIANTQIYILDEQLRPVPIGSQGELHIGGVQVAQGYLNRPRLTAEKFIRDPFSDDPSARLYKSGDLARFSSDGQVEYIGRIDFQVKIRGLRIELGEIESSIAELEGIKQCVAVVREDTPGDKRIVAYFEASQSCQVKVDKLRESLKMRLPSYMIPQYFIEIEKFPLSVSGKIDRKSLPKPAESKNDNYPSIIKPATATEKALARIWQDLIGISEISVDANFFELGGHSFLAMQAISQIRKNFGVDITPLSMIGDSLAQIASTISTSTTVNNIELARPTTQTSDTLATHPRELAKPIYFGPNATLYGVYHPAHQRADSQGAVLLCSPLYLEGISAHWAFRQLALKLSSNGFDVLRFDYFATGDSFGNDDEGGVEQWCFDINAAARMLIQSSGHESISIVGLRFGATLASLANVANVAQLILWQPVFSGEKYVKSLLFKYSETVQELNLIRKTPVRKNNTEIVGFDFPKSIRRSLCSANLFSGQGLTKAAKVTLVASDYDNQNDKIETLRQQFIEKTRRFEFHPVDEQLSSLENYTDLATYLPGKNLDIIVNKVKEGVS